MPRIVFTTFGSLGDLHPYLAIALGLKARGHDPVIATSATYRQKIEDLGLRFHAVAPDVPDDKVKTELVKRIMDARTGPETVVREIIVPALRESYADTQAAAEGADLLVGHPLTFTTRLVAEKTDVPWVSSVLAPLSFFSSFDPPVILPVPLLWRLRFLGPLLFWPLFRLGRLKVRGWSRPWHALRAELGLPPAADPLFEGAHSPRLVLAPFSRLLGAPARDWPTQTAVTGFAFYDRDGAGGMPEELTRFLDAGEPPLVFTLGSSAVLDAGRFYEHSAEAARRLRRRAVLLIGKETTNRPTRLPDGVVAFDYAPYSELLPRAAAIVHQGGVGTTGQAMRSGRPMLVMPYAHDQFDNAARVARIGIARTIRRQQYNAERAAKELRTLLESPVYAARADRVGKQVLAEDGVAAACAEIERVLARR